MIRDQYIHTGKEKEHNEKTCGGTKADNGKQDMGQQRKDFGDPKKKLITKYQKHKSCNDQQSKKQSVNHCPET